MFDSLKWLVFSGITMRRCKSTQKNEDFSYTSNSKLNNALHIKLSLQESQPNEYLSGDDMMVPIAPIPHGKMDSQESARKFNVLT